jgi:hypothetical protein
MTTGSLKMKKTQSPKKASRPAWSKAEICADPPIRIDLSFVTIILALNNITNSLSITIINVCISMLSPDRLTLHPALADRMVMPTATMATTVTVLLHIMVDRHRRLRPGLCIGSKRMKTKTRKAMYTLNAEEVQDEIIRPDSQISTLLEEGRLTFCSFCSFLLTHFSF